MTKTLAAFISYSHLDEHALERFTKHLAGLRRDKIIAEWYDQKILPGGSIDDAISKHLDKCDVFIPLVSPDFLGSTYCHDREMSRALELHEQGTLRIVPIIIQPCDWKNSRLGNLKAIPKDGTPVSEWTNENTAWLDVVQQLRRLAAEYGGAESNDSGPSVPKSVISARYRAKKDFDDIDKMDFREKAFATIREYFKNAASEIAVVDGIRAKFSDMADDAFTCTVVNRGRGRAISHITVYSRTRRMAVGDITYAFVERAEPSTANGWLNVESDDYELHLKMNRMMSSGDENEKLTPNRAAELLWEEFLERADISYA